MKQGRAAIAVLHRHGRYFAQRRDAAAAVLPGLWEFPGGKLEPLESPLQALRRELEEEIHVQPATLIPLPVIAHRYPDLALTLHPFLCEGGPEPRTRLAWGWFTARELAILPMPPANGFLVASLGQLAQEQRKC